jgi:hypothetical protein
MNYLVRRRDNCRLCESKDVDLVLPLAPSALAEAYVPADRLHEPQDAYPLDLVLCRRCGHVQIPHVIDPEYLFSNYSYVSSSSPGLAEHFRGYADRIVEKFNPGAGKLVVDIGSNDGTLLRFFAARGLKVLGVDPAREIARRATDSGIRTLPVFFTPEVVRTIRSEFGPATVVTANNVFAHNDHLGDMADGVQGLLASDGIFVFEVSYLVDTVQSFVWDFIYHEHLCYHSVRPLRTFLERHGMELIDAERVPIKGGSLRAVAQRKGGPRPVAASVDRLLALEDLVGVYNPETYREYGEAIDRLKRKTLALIDRAKVQGKSVAGYGASATVTTLLHHFDLGSRIDFLVDDNPMRQGSYSPGHHIPVVAPDALYERLPDFTVLLAWRFADMIVRKHQRYLDEGGFFIQPMPLVKVL